MYNVPKGHFNREFKDHLRYRDTKGKSGVLAVSADVVLTWVGIALVSITFCH